MEETLKAIASTLDIDVRILRELYAKGYSDGYDVGYNTSRPEPYVSEQYYQTFNTNRNIGQRE